MPNNVRLIVTPSLWILGALMLLILPLNWLLAAVTAALFHEFCHYLSLKFCSVPIQSIQLSGGGAVISTGPMTPRQELICAMAGPLGGLCLLPLVRYVPRIAICAAAQSLFNLLPIYPLDGGRALNSIVRRYLSPALAVKFLKWTTRLCMGSIFFLGLLASLRYHLGLFPLLTVIILCIRAKKEKLLANRRS